MPNNIDNHALLSSQGIGNALENAVENAVGAISPLNDFGRYMTGSRAVIKVNDKLFGFAFGVSFNVETRQDEIWTIDDQTPYELAPNKIRVNGTISMFHIPGKGPTMELVQPNVLGFLFHKYITIRIEDQLTGQLIFETRRAQITSRKQSLTAGELSTIELEWKAIGWRDQQAPFYPSGHNGEEGGGSQGLLNQISNAFG